MFHVLFSVFGWKNESWTSLAAAEKTRTLPERLNIIAERLLIFACGCFSSSMAALVRLSEAEKDISETAGQIYMKSLTTMRHRVYQ